MIEQEEVIVTPPGVRDPRPPRRADGRCPECGCDRRVRVMSGDEYCAECGYEVGGRHGRK